MRQLITITEGLPLLGLARGQVFKAEAFEHEGVPYWRFVDEAGVDTCILRGNAQLAGGQ